MHVSRTLLATAVAGSLALASLPLAAQSDSSGESSDSSESKDVSTDPSERDLSDLTKREKQKFLTHLESGEEAYSGGEFEKAIPFFENAFEIYPDPRILAKIALSYERSGEPRKAIEYYERFLEEAPDSEKRGQVERTLESLRDQVQVRVRVESDPSRADVYFGNAEGEPRGETPLDVSLPSKKDRTEVFVKKQGYETARQSVELEEGTEKELAFTLVESSGGRGKGGGSNTGAIVMTSVGGASALAAGTFGVLYGRADSEFQDLRDRTRGSADDPATRQEVEDAAQRSNLYQGLLWGTGGLAVASLGTATVLWLTGNSGAADDRAARLDLLPAVRFRDRGASVHFEFRF